MAEKRSEQLTTDEEREVREAEQRLEAHLQVVEKAFAEGRLADLIRDTPSVRERLQSSPDA